MSDDSQGPHGSGVELAQIIPRHVLDHAPSGVAQPAVGVQDLDADEKLPHPAHCRAIAPGQSRGDGPADGGMLIVGWAEGQELSGLGQRFLEPFQGTARLYGDRQVAGAVVQNSVPSTNGKDVGRPFRLVSQEPLPAASPDEDRISRLIPLTDPVAARRRVGRFMNRRDAALQIQPATSLRG